MFEVETYMHIRSFMFLHRSFFTTFVYLYKGPVNKIGMFLYFKGCMNKIKGCGDGK